MWSITDPYISTIVHSILLISVQGTRPAGLDLTVSHDQVLEKAMAPHSSTLAWKIPWTEEPGRLQSMGSHRVGCDWATSLSLFTFMHWRRKWATHSSVLAWRIPGTVEHGGLPSPGSHRVGHDWSDLAAAAWPSHYKKTPPESQRYLGKK